MLMMIVYDRMLFNLFNYVNVAVGGNSTNLVLLVYELLRYTLNGVMYGECQWIGKRNYKTLLKIC